MGILKWTPILLAVLASPVEAQPPALEGLDRYVRRAVSDWNVPGLAVAVVKDGDVVFLRGYGVRRLGSEAPVDENTLFAIGSTTKAMTAAAVGMLVDEGKLDWDDAVIEHLPWFRLHDPVLTREVTIRDLLTHRAGLPNADFLWYGQDNEPREILRRMRFVEPETSLRSHFTYQNVMYAAAGAVVARASGLSWEGFVEARIFEPLGMTRTVPTAAGLSERSNVASPHFRDGDEVRVIENATVDAVAPAGAVWSSVSDMSRWMQYLLEGQTPDGRRLLKEETLEELFTPQMIVAPEGFYPTMKLTEPHWTTYGLGWFQHDYRGRAVDFHTGSIDGMVAIHGLIRDDRLGVYLLGNLDHAELRHAIMYRVFDLYGGGPDRDWSRELRALYAVIEGAAEARDVQNDNERVPGTEPTLALERYAGTYRDQLYGTARVTLDSGVLRLHYGPGLVGTLSHWHYDWFQVSWDAWWRGETLVGFRLGPDGEVSTLEVRDAELRRVRAEEDSGGR